MDNRVGPLTVADVIQIEAELLDVPNKPVGLDFVRLHQGEILSQHASLATRDLLMVAWGEVTTLEAYVGQPDWMDIDELPPPDAPVARCSLTTNRYWPKDLEASHE